MARPAVLMYHAFGRREPAEDPHNLFVPEDALGWQLPAITRLGPLGLDEYLARLPRGGTGVLVTIDDGYESTLDIAAPLLAQRAIPAVLFVPPALLGSTSRWMPEMPGERLLSSDRLRELASYGIEIGAHGYDHTELADLDESELRRQTAGARDALADLTGVLPRSFAFPRGSHDAAAREAVRSAGFLAAFAVYDGAGSRWDLLRSDVNALDTPRSFALKCRRWYPRARQLADRAPALRRAAHRVVGVARR